MRRVARILFACLASLRAAAVVAWSVSETCSADRSGSQRCRPAGDSSGGVHSAVPAVVEKATADLITQEVDELKSFINICEERISLLHELRATITSGHNVSIPESHVKILQEKLPLLSEVTLDEGGMPTGSADDYLISKAVIPQEEPVSFVKFLPLRNPRTSSSTSTAQTALPSALLVAAQADGAVRLFSPSGELVLTFTSGHDSPITNLAVSPSHDEYFITTADATGVIRVHKVNVRQRRLSKEQKQARRNSWDEKVSQYLGTQINVTFQFTKQMEVPPREEDGDIAPLTTLAVSSQQGTKYFLAGDAEGSISVFTRNGTFRGRIDVALKPGSAVDYLFAQLSNLLFRVGTDWGFINPEKMEATHMDCPRFEGHVAAAVVDSQQSNRILVADEEGTVWVFNAKSRKDCKVEHRFRRGTTKGRVELASVRGFVVALERGDPALGDSTQMVALNMSHIGKKRDQMSSEVVWRRGRQPARDWAVHKRYQQGDLLAFLSEDGNEIEIMELLMQVYQAPASNDFGNFKLPVIAVAIVLVLGYQYIKQKGKFGGGKKIDWDSADFSALRNKKKLGGLAGLKKGRGGLGAKF